MAVSYILPICLLTLAVSISTCAGQAPVIRNVMSSSPKGQKELLQLLRQSSVPMTLLNHPRVRQNVSMPALRYQKNSVCSCRGMQCGCCIHLDVSEIGLDETGCVNVTYLSKEIGFEFTLSIDGVVLVDKKISVSNPPPICAAIPYLKKYASACVKFSHLDFQHEQFSGCVSVEIEFAGEVLVNYDLGCFHIPPSDETINLDAIVMKIVEKSLAQRPGSVVPYGYHGLQTLEDLKHHGNDLCSCKGYGCGCCIHLEVKKISLNDTGCVNISYLPSELGFEFQASIDGRTLIDEKVSVRNPPPFCVAVPYLHKLASVCVHFRDLQIKDKQFSGCAVFEARLAGEIVETFDLGCFYIPPRA